MHWVKPDLFVEVTYLTWTEDNLLGRSPIKGGGRTSPRGRVLAVAAPVTTAWAVTDAECQEMWAKADTNKDGVLADNESMRYVALMRVGDRTIATEGKITKAEFIDACKVDIYAPRKAEAGAPLKGANSFTEGQAKDRAIGYGGVDSVSGFRRTMTGSGAVPATRAATPCRSRSIIKATSSPRPSSRSVT